MAYIIYTRIHTADSTVPGSFGQGNARSFRRTEIPRRITIVREGLCCYQNYHRFGSSMLLRNAVTDPACWSPQPWPMFSPTFVPSYQFGNRRFYRISEKPIPSNRVRFTDFIASFRHILLILSEKVSAWRWRAPRSSWTRSLRWWRSWSW